jgi:hypothetical protein
MGRLGPADSLQKKKTLIVFGVCGFYILLLETHVVIA